MRAAPLRRARTVVVERLMIVPSGFRLMHRRLSTTWIAPIRPLSAYAQMGDTPGGEEPSYRIADAGMAWRQAPYEHSLVCHDRERPEDGDIPRSSEDRLEPLCPGSGGRNPRTTWTAERGAAGRPRPN